MTRDVEHLFYSCVSYVHVLTWESQVLSGKKNQPVNEGDTRHMGSISEPGRYLGLENVNSLQYSCLENSMDREAWWAIVHRVAKSGT